MFSSTEDAPRALAAMTPARPEERTGVSPLPPAVPPLRDPGYHAVRSLLTAAGVPFPAAREITGETEVLAAAAEFDGPYVLKALHVLHESDAGGVVLGPADRDALLAAYRDMHARLGVPSYSVEEMAELGDGVELLVGVDRDPRFGPVAMVGLGGVLTETLHDVAFSLAPIAPRAASCADAGAQPPYADDQFTAARPFEIVVGAGDGSRAATAGPPGSPFRCRLAGHPEGAGR